MEKPIEVLLADDHPLIREGIGNTLNREDSLVLVGVATNAHEAQRLSESLHPDVLLLDLNMPGPPPLETIYSLKSSCPQTHVLVLSAYDDYVSVRALLRAGVSGYVLKDEAIETLVKAIHAVAAGQTWFSQILIQQLAQISSVVPDFTKRELDVLHYLARGWTNERIADRLAVTERTIRFHLKNIYKKLEVKSRGEAIVWAVRSGYGNHQP